MYITARKEAFSRAWLSAICAATGYRVQSGPDPDDDSVDLTIAARGPMGVIRSPELDVQLKCTATPPAEGDTWPFDLKVKNYNDLRHTDLQVPRILLVLVVPVEPADWIVHDPAHMLPKHCAWWMSLRGMPATTNETQIRIAMPAQQIFDSEALKAMMARVGNGGAP
jgi:hypothetical protein